MSCTSLSPAVIIGYFARVSSFLWHCSCSFSRMFCMSTVRTDRWPCQWKFLIWYKLHLINFVIRWFIILWRRFLFLALRPFANAIDSYPGVLSSELVPFFNPMIPCSNQVLFYLSLLLNPTRLWSLVVPLLTIPLLTLFRSCPPVNVAVLAI